MGVWSLNLTGDWQLGEEMNIYRSHSRLSLPLWLVSGSTVYRLCRGFLVDTMMLENARGAREENTFSLWEQGQSSSLYARNNVISGKKGTSSEHVARTRVVSAGISILDFCMLMLTHLHLSDPSLCYHVPKKWQERPCRDL